MKKVISLILSVTMLLSVTSCVDFSAFAIDFFPYEGSCGYGVEYSYNSSKKEVTISGNGEMFDYSLVDVFDTPFYNRTFNKVEIKPGVTYMGQYTFYNCSIEEMIVPCDLFYYSKNSSYIPLKNASVKKVTITKGKSTEILDCIFNGSGNTGTDTSPGSNVVPWTSGHNIQEIVIQNGITRIGANAFCRCSSKINCLSIPSSVTSIGTKAFYDVPAVLYSGNATGSPWNAKVVCKVWDSQFGYTDTTKTILGKYLSTTSESCVLPNTVKTIKGKAFLNCSNLKNVTIGNNVSSIENDAFNGCTGLTSVHVNNLEHWCNISFGNNTANPLNYAHDLYINDKLLNKIEIPETIKTI